MEVLVAGLAAYGVIMTVLFFWADDLKNMWKRAYFQSRELNREMLNDLEERTTAYADAIDKFTKLKQPRDERGRFKKVK